MTPPFSLRSEHGFFLKQLLNLFYFFNGILNSHMPGSLHIHPHVPAFPRIPDNIWDICFSHLPLVPHLPLVRKAPSTLADFHFESPGFLTFQPSFLLLLQSHPDKMCISSPDAGWLMGSEYLGADLQFHQYESQIVKLLMQDGLSLPIGRDNRLLSLLT